MHTSIDINVSVYTVHTDQDQMAIPSLMHSDSIESIKDDKLVKDFRLGFYCQ